MPRFRPGADLSTRRAVLRAIVSLQELTVIGSAPFESTFKKEEFPRSSKFAACP
jgi:hypothetical protein